MKTAEPTVDPYRPPTSLTEPEEMVRFQHARLRMLLAVMFCYLFYYTGRQVFGYAIPGIEKEFGVTKLDLGWCSTGLLWAYAIGQAINGQLADRFGGRHMMALGAIASCALNWTLSFSQSIMAIGVIWTINGFAQSLGWAPGSRILSNWWEKKDRGLVYGWYLFAAGFGSIIAYAGAINAASFGWRWIFRLPVLLLLVGAVVFWFVARNRPSEVGLRDLRPEEGEPEDHEQESVGSRYRVALSNPRFLLGCCSIGFQNLARYGLLIWVPVHTSGKWVGLALPVGMAIGAVTSGWLSDRVFGGKRSQVIIIFLLCAAVCGGVLTQVPAGHFLAIPVLFLIGFFVYGPQAGYWALCPDLLGRRYAGTGTGVMNFFAYLFAGLGEPLIGSIIDHHKGNTAVFFYVVASACVLGAVLMRFVRR